MKFLRLQDPLLSVLFEDDDILAIDKPYGLNTHTNDSKLDHSEFIQDGLIEIFEKQLGIRLYIIHRLDQTTTGVLVFGKSPEAAKKYAEFFFNRQVKKTYWFLTASQSQERQERQEKQFLIDQEIVYKAKELAAQTQFHFIKKSKKFELWKANPLTGRNHQIRIHGKAAGIPLLGDEKYGGQDFPFLCLHNHRIEFPNKVVIESEPPIYFQDLELLGEPIVRKALFERDRRLRLYSGAFNSAQCFRWLHPLSSAKEAGFSMDQMGPYLLVHWQKDFWGETEIQKFATLSKLVEKPILFRIPQGKSASDAPPVTWIGQEQSLKYELKESAPSGGLHLNSRLQRNWILAQAKAKAVLNLFAHNCSFSVAAAAGGAKEVISVESSKASLAWGKRNFELNGLQSQSHKFLLRESWTYLKQAQAKNLKFDLVVCDVPSFVRGERANFKIEKDLENFLKDCFQVLNPKGQLLFSTSFESYFIDDLRKLIEKQLQALRISNFEIYCLLPSFDFELPDERVSLKSFLIQI